MAKYFKNRSEKLIEKNSGLAAAISTKINIAHQDKYYTDTEAMNEYKVQSDKIKKALGNYL